MSYNLPIINTLRGVAALSVCLFHFICSTYITDESLNYIFDFGKKGVQVFFIISGIVIPLSMLSLNYKYTRIGSFLKTRFVRIEPPYLIAVILGIIYLNVRNLVPSSSDIDVSPSIRDIFLHIGYLIPFVYDAKWIVRVFWTLSIEFQYYLFLAISLPLFISKKIVFNILFILILLILPFVNNRFHLFPFWSSYFGLGIVYAFFISNQISKLNYFLYSLLLAIVVIYNQGLLDLSIALTTLLLIHYFKDFNPRIGNWLGKISYSLYLTHALVGLSFINLMSTRVTSNLGKFIIELIAFLITIIFSFYFWKYIEKPSQDWSKKFKTNI